MPFSIPDDLRQFSADGLADLARIATDELRTLRASVADPATMDDDTLTRVEALSVFVASAETEATERAARLARFQATEPVVAVEPESVTASTAEPVATPAEPVRDASATVAPLTVANSPATVVAATVTHSSAVEPRTATVAEVAPNAPAVELGDGEASRWVIRAASDVPGY